MKIINLSCYYSLFKDFSQRQRLFFLIYQYHSPDLNCLYFICFLLIIQDFGIFIGPMVTAELTCRESQKAIKIYAIWIPKTGHISEAQQSRKTKIISIILDIFYTY